MATPLPKPKVEVPTVNRTPDEAAALANCADLIRRCQLSDGAFIAKREGNPILVVPYFSNYAALALLAYGDPQDLPRVEKWLIWYAKHQLPDGSINDWEGGFAEGYRDTGRRDSVDAYAATYLLAVERYVRIKKQLPVSVLAAARGALKAIQSMTDEKDGLTWAKEGYRFKLLQDNVVTYGGLIAAQRLFVQWTQDKALSTTAGQMAQKLGGSLPIYLRQDGNSKTFFYAYDDAGFQNVKSPGAEGMAIIFGTAWITNADKTPWERMKGYEPDSGIAPAAPVERWYIGALGSGDNPQAYRAATVAQAKAFVFDQYAPPANDAYIHRPAIAMLALLEGSKWLPSIMDAPPAKAPLAPASVPVPPPTQKPLRNLIIP